MMRPAREVSSIGRPSSWLIVMGGFIAYLGLVFVLSRAGMGPEVSLLPWWVAQPAPPVLYAVVVFVVARPGSWLHLLAGTLLLWAVHLLVGVVAGALVGVFQASGSGGAAWAFPPPPMPGLLWVPLLLIPLRDLLRGDSGRRRRPTSAGRAEARAVTERRAPVAPTSPVPGRVPLPAPAATAPARAVSAMPVMSMDVRYDAGHRPLPPTPGAAAKRAAETAPGEASAAPRAKKETKAGPEASHAQHLLDDLLARERSGEPVRVSFKRVAPQLPAEVFSAPLDEVAAALEEPGRLRVPRRLALTQLTEGIVRVGWDVVAGQFPRHLLAAADEDIKGRLPDGQLVLPLDEVVRQFPPELFLPVGPGPNLQGIEVFAAPFQPISAGDDHPTHPAPTASAAQVVAVQPPREAAVPGHGAQPMLEVPSIQPLPPPEPLVDAGAAPAQTEELEPVRAGELVDIAPARLDVGAEAGRDEPETELPCADAMPVGITPVEAAPVAAWVSAPPQATEDGPVRPAEQALVSAIPEPGQGPVRLPCEAAPAIPAPASRATVSVRGGLDAARALAALAAPPGPIEVSASVVDGVELFAVTSVGLGSDLASTAARLILPLLADGRAPWPIDQVTLRGPRGALVLTLLGPLATGGPVLAATVPVGRPLALLEIRCREASAGYAARADGAATRVGAPAGEREEPDLLDVEPSTRVREIAASLGALGPVTASALRDAEAARPLYLFLPPGCDVRLMGAFANDLSDAMRQAAATGVVWSVAFLRSGARRLVIRPPAAASGGSDTIVAAGETSRPGLAYRQVEHAAAALGRL